MRISERSGPIKMRRHTCQALTLVEVLVAVAIVAILVALSLAGASKARDKGRKIQCANNVRQLGVALQTFVSDHNFYPLHRNLDNVANGEPATWTRALEQAALSGRSPAELRAKGGDWWKNTVWRCPSTPSELLDFDTGPSTSVSVRVLGYGYNAYGLRRYRDADSLGLGGRLGNTPANYVASTPIRELEVVRPAEMMAIGDAFVGGNEVIVDTTDRLQRTGGLSDVFGSTSRSQARHQGRANVWFADGHVESPSLKSLFDHTDDAALSRWNRDHKPHRERLEQ